MKIYNGHQLWEIDPFSGQVVKAKGEKKQGLIYISALNAANAQKKLHKLFGSFDQYMKTKNP